MVLFRVRRKQRKAARERRKLRDKLALNMVIKGDTIAQTDDISLFDLKKIKSQQVGVLHVTHVCQRCTVCCCGRH